MLYLVLHFLNLAVQLAVRVVQDNCSNDVSRYSASSAKICLLRHVYVRHILVFAQKRQVKNDFKWLGVSSKDD